MFLILFLIILSCRVKPNQEINRVVSLSPAATEIIYSLKAENKLIGVTSYCNYPEDVKNKEIVGDFSNPSIEKIISLKPSFVILAGKGQGIVDRRIKSLGIRTYLYEVRSIQDIKKHIKKLGEILDKEKEADVLIKNFEKEIGRFKRSRKNRCVKVFIELNSKPLYTSGKNSFISEMISIAGGINIGDVFRRDYLRVNPEWVLRKKPDIIILTSLKKNEFIKIYPVFKGFKVVDSINPDLIVRPSIRIIKGIKELRRIIYEE